MLQRGDRVRHWFAGIGTIRDRPAGKVVWVKWDADGYGFAYVVHCHKI